MSSTYHRIYSVVKQIPAGQVTTYGQVGHVVGCPARQVGYAMAALESDSSVPWHRVINRRGLISARRDGLPDERQRRLLQAEGIVFSVSGVIDLTCYSWRGPDWFILIDRKNESTARNLLAIGHAGHNCAAPLTPALSPLMLLTMGVANSSLKTY